MLDKHITREIKEQKYAVKIESDYNIIAIEREKHKQQILIIILFSIIAIIALATFFLVRYKKLKHKSEIQLLRITAIREAEDQEREGHQPVEERRLVEELLAVHGGCDPVSGQDHLLRGGCVHPLVDVPQRPITQQREEQQQAQRQQDPQINPQLPSVQ